MEIPIELRFPHKDIFETLFYSILFWAANGFFLLHSFFIGFVHAIPYTLTDAILIATVFIMQYPRNFRYKMHLNMSKYKASTITTTTTMKMVTAPAKRKERERDIFQPLLFHWEVAKCIFECHIALCLHHIIMVTVSLVHDIKFITFLCTQFYTSFAMKN